MAARNIPRSHYLLIHDALRQTCSTLLSSQAAAAAPPVSLSAFVTSPHPCQCDMLINSAVTDPTYLSDPQQQQPHHRYRQLLSTLQSNLRLCQVRAPPPQQQQSTGSKRNLDLQAVPLYYDPSTTAPDCVLIDFRDDVTVRVALGAPRPTAPTSSSSSTAAAPDPSSPSSSPSELVEMVHTVLGRRRLRMCLGGFDESLFIHQCSTTERRAAMELWQWTYQHCSRFPAGLISHPILTMRNQSQQHDAMPPLNELLPPYYYWLAHTHEAAAAAISSSSSQHAPHHVDLVRVVREHFTLSHTIPLLNPFFPGENLNSMSVVRWYSSLFLSPLEAAAVMEQYQVMSS